MTSAFTKSNGSKESKNVVLVEYPTKRHLGQLVLLRKKIQEKFLDKTNKKLINVFVPTTPNPTSGFLLMFPAEEVIYLRSNI